LGGVYRELPAEIKAAAPFDTSCLSINPAENREQLYLRTFIFSNPTSLRNRQGWYADDAVAAKIFGQPSNKSRLEKSIRALMKLDDFRRKCEGWDHWKERFEIEKKRVRLAKKQQASFAPILDELEAAQEARPRCQFHWTHSSNRTDPLPFQLPYFDRMIELQIVLAGEFEDDLQFLDTMLTVERDVASLRHESWSSRNERLLLEHLTKKMLSSDLSDEQLNKLIDVLLRHQRDADRYDMTTEIAKSRYLQNVDMLINLREKKYLITKRGTQFWDESTAIEQTISRVLPNVGSCSSVEHLILQRLDSPHADRMMLSESQKNELRTIAGKFRAAFKAQDAFALRKFLAATVTDMTSVDFASEIEIQAKRYRQIKAACDLPYAERSKTLKLLDLFWLTDSSWTKSKILMFLTSSAMLDEEPAVRFYRRASTTAALVKSWRLKHPGKVPTSLKEVFDFANAGPVLQDPYARKPLQMSNSKVTIEIQSVGPDPAIGGLRFVVDFVKQ
jgi:diadenosine tetraphosphatase ApaH/serine/threonine PP2A family protein phosphatase